MSTKGMPSSQPFSSFRSLRLAIAAAAAVLAFGCGPLPEGEPEELGAETETVQQALYTMTVIWPSAAVRSQPDQNATKLQVIYNGDRFYATGQGSCTDYCYWYGRTAQYTWGWIRSDAVH